MLTPRLQSPDAISATRTGNTDNASPTNVLLIGNISLLAGCNFSKSQTIVVPNTTFVFALWTSWRSASLGHARRARFPQARRMDWVRSVLGRAVADASQLPGLDAGSATLASLGEAGLQTAEVGGALVHHCRPVLCPLDDPQLRSEDERF